MAQATIPNIVGSNIDIIVHFILLVSFNIVRQVVEQGQCISEKTIVQIAVFIVHPFNNSMFLISTRLLICESSPDKVYAIIAIGITISLAGNPRINAASKTPSNPIILAIGSRKSVICFKIEISEIVILAKSHITIPVGNATKAARPKTNNVLSKTERTIVLPILGTLYGGNSNVKEDASPFNNVLDNNLDERNVIIIPSNITKTKIATPTKEENTPVHFPIRNIEIIEIIAGNLPLHGTNVFVSIAISLSRGESIIRAPTMPHALHPKPIHIVKACFPHALHFLKVLSILKAILGKYPKSSSNVNSGKNIAIGGNITETTHVKTLYPPPKYNTREILWNF